MLLSDFPAGRRAALDRLARIRPDRYARSRNFLAGAVTRLSPYLRHGILDLAEVRDAALSRVDDPRDAYKFIAELGWRDYFRRIYDAIGSRVWDDLEPYKTGWNTASYAVDLPDDIRSGTTGAACIDGFVSDLVDGGYVHNHARMYFSSYVVHHRRIRWQAGAAFYLANLIDGDAASNNLSWQWVASTFSRDPYFFNRENLERYTAGVYCRTCPLAHGGCPFDASYAELRSRLFPHRAIEDVPATEATRIVLRVPPDSPAPKPPGAARVVLWAHTDALSDVNVARESFADAPVIFAWDALSRSDEAWSSDRIAFIEGALAEMRIDERIAFDPVRTAHTADGRIANTATAIAAFARKHDATAIVTVASVDPGLRAIGAAIERKLPLIALQPPAFAVLDRAVDLRRFSRYWKRAQASAFTITPPA